MISYCLLRWCKFRWKLRTWSIIYTFAMEIKFYHWFHHLLFESFTLTFWFFAVLTSIFLYWLIITIKHNLTDILLFLLRVELGSWSIKCGPVLVIELVTLWQSRSLFAWNILLTIWCYTLWFLFSRLQLTIGNSLWLLNYFFNTFLIIFIDAVTITLILVTDRWCLTSWIVCPVW